MGDIKLRDVILFSLEKAIDGAVRLDDFMTHTYIYAQGYDRPLKKSALASALQRLRKQGLIENMKNEGSIIYRLTETGRDWAIKHISETEIEWDGIWRIVIFDIPEQHKRVRNILRRRLKEWGFVIWQKSVWASKKPLTEQLRKLVQDLGVEDWVLVIESTDVGH